MGLVRTAKKWTVRAVFLKLVVPVFLPLTLIFGFLVVVLSLGFIAGYSEWESNKEVQSVSCRSQIVSDGDASTVNVPEEYREAIDKAGAESGLPAQIIAAQIQAESNWNPKAVSPVGAKGLTQFMPDTWNAIAPGEDPFDPFASIAAQGRYMKQLKEQLEHLADGDANRAIELALAGYNAGPGVVLQYGGIPPFGETQNYVVKIMGASQMKYSKDCERVAKAWDGDLGDGEWTSPCPDCVKTSGYERRALAVDDQNGNFHWGIDLATLGAGNSPGGPIVAPVNLRIVEIYQADGCVLAYATEGPEFGFKFCHLHTIDVSAGMEVKRGDILGVEGGTGGGAQNRFATHLHLEIYKPGHKIENFGWFNDRSGNIDPEPILREKGAMG